MENEEHKAEGLEDISNIEGMAKVPKLPETTYHPLKPYKSVEEIIFVDSGIRDFLVYGGKELYGTVASMFRIPTLARKIYNQQILWHRDNKELNVVACSFGLIVDGFYLAYSIQQVCEKGNYFPLAVLAATNLVSGAYELGRLSRSKQENLELKAQIEAEKVNAGKSNAETTPDKDKSP